jgi:hypothetical protein
MPILIESPATSDPIKKIKFARRRIGFRPKMSDILPH